MSGLSEARDAFKNDSTTKDGSAGTLPDVPATEALSHEVTAWKKAVGHVLSKLDLNQVAAGRLSLRAQRITMHDVASLESLLANMPHNHPQILTVKLKITEHEEKNKQKLLEQHAVVLDDVTKLFWLLYASCEKNQPGLQEELLKTCTIKNPAQWKCDVAGRYDGVQAMKMVMSVHLKARSKPDYLYYEKALRLTERNKLSNGCTANEFEKRTLKLRTMIYPNLERQFSVEGISQQLIDTMPPNLKDEGKRIKRELQASGEYLDHETVVRHCLKAVSEETTSGAKSGFVLVSEEDLEGLDIESCAFTTGINFKLKQRSSPNPNRKKGSDGEKKGDGAACKWCGAE